MRKICFKAKRIDNGEWVEGYLFFIVDTPYIICDGETMCMDGENTDLYATEWYEVAEDTICQYTGLTDKNGNKIWENDVVKHYYNQNKPTRFTIGTICWNADKMRYERYERSSQYERKIFSVSYDCVYEVIGNIFDNPELLEGGAENG